MDLMVDMQCGGHGASVLSSDPAQTKLIVNVWL